MTLPPPETLRSALVTLRPPVPGDVDAVRRTFCDEEASTRFVAWRPKRSVEQARRFLDLVIADGGRGRPSWVIERNRDGRAVGFIIAACDGDEAETSYTVAPAAWGGGLATAAVGVLAARLLAVPGVARVRALCDAENRASARVLEKAGFRLVRRLPRHGRHNLSPEPRDCLLFHREREPAADGAGLSPGSSSTGRRARGRAQESRRNGPRRSDSMPKMKAYASFDLYLADQPPRNRAVIGALRGFVRKAAPGLEESVKWGNGCWLADGAPIAYVYSDRDHVQFGFIRGASLRDPLGLLQGKGRFVRHVKVRGVAEIDRRAFGALLGQAVRLGGVTRARGGRSRAPAPGRRRGDAACPADGRIGAPDGPLASNDGASRRRTPTRGPPSSFPDGDAVADAPRPPPIGGRPAPLRPNRGSL